MNITALQSFHSCLFPLCLFHSAAFTPQEIGSAARTHGHDTHQGKTRRAVMGATVAHGVFSTSLFLVLRTSCSLECILLVFFSSLPRSYCTVRRILCYDYVTLTSFFHFYRPSFFTSSTLTRPSSIISTPTRPPFSSPHTHTHARARKSFSIVRYTVSCTMSLTRSMSRPVCSGGTVLHLSLLPAPAIHTVHTSTFSHRCKATVDQCKALQIPRKTLQSKDKYSARHAGIY